MKNLTLFCTLFLNSGCGLIATTFEGNVSVDFTVDTDGTEYSDIVTVDPNENEDVRANRDRIQELHVKSIVFSVEGIHENNEAFTGSGEIYVRSIGEEWGETPVAEFVNAPVEVGFSKTLAITEAEVEDLERIVNDVFEARIRGNTDGVLGFDGRLTFELEIVAGL